MTISYLPLLFAPIALALPASGQVVRASTLNKKPVVALPSAAPRRGTGPEYGTVRRVLDADTYEVLLPAGLVRVRLPGVDAPELSQPYGRQAADSVARLLRGRVLEVERLGVDGYGRTLAGLRVGVAAGPLAGPFGRRWLRWIVCWWCGAGPGLTSRAGRCRRWRGCRSWPSASGAGCGGAGLPGWCGRACGGPSTNRKKRVPGVAVPGSSANKTAGQVFSFQPFFPFTMARIRSVLGTIEGSAGASPSLRGGASTSCVRRWAATTAARPPS